MKILQYFLCASWLIINTIHASHEEKDSNNAPFVTTFDASPQKKQSSEINFEDSAPENNITTQEAARYPKRQVEAATKIQRAWREHAARKEKLNKKEEKTDLKENRDEENDHRQKREDDSDSDSEDENLEPEKKERNLSKFVDLDENTRNFLERFKTTKDGQEAQDKINEILKDNQLTQGELDEIYELRDQYATKIQRAWKNRNKGAVLKYQEKTEVTLPDDVKEILDLTIAINNFALNCLDKDGINEINSILASGKITFSGIKAIRNDLAPEYIQLPEDIAILIHKKIKKLEETINNPYDLVTGKKDDDEFIKDTVLIKQAFEKIIETNKICDGLAQEIRKNIVEKAATKIQSNFRKHSCVKKYSQALLKYQQETEVALPADVQSYLTDQLATLHLQDNNTQDQQDVLSNILDSQKISLAVLMHARHELSLQNEIIDLTQELEILLQDRNATSFVENKDDIQKILQSKKLTKKLAQKLYLAALCAKNDAYENSSRNSDQNNLPEVRQQFNESFKFYENMKSLQNNLFVDLPAWLQQKFNYLTIQEKLAFYRQYLQNKIGYLLKREPKQEEENKENKPRE